MIRRPPRSTLSSSSAASDVYKRQAFGCGVEKPGDTVVSLGTSGTVVAVTATPNPDLTGRVHLFSHVTKDCYYHMAVILSAAGALDWFRQRFAQNLSYGRIEEMV